ncbi:MAG: hypothetical protein LQ339_000796 [Xanthoria mediterranea]|nr:MAG: hypothetical protein LQ339_000796 [Xanthoria mediterranea]
MSSPLSTPFSVFPSQQTTYNCNYKSCPGRFTHLTDLDRHNAVHHSSMGHSPITALNIRVLLPTFPSPPSTSVPETDLPLPLPPTTHHNLDPQHHQQQEEENPTRPPPPSSSLESLITYPHHSAPTVSSSSSYSSSSSSSSSSSTSSPTTHKTFKWPSLSVSVSSPKKQPKPKMRRSTSTTMRCGRHGDEWLGVRGWRFWR